MDKEKILEKIKAHYLNSDDFNGLPLFELKPDDKKNIKELINEGFVEAISNAGNNHIKHFNQTESVEDQIKNISEWNNQTCLYPTPKSLKDVPKDKKKYTALLQSGCGQKEVRYFEVGILEEYFNNPQYVIWDFGFRGSIGICSEFIDDVSIDDIEDYGIAYPKDGRNDRAVAVFLRDLAKLSYKSQLRWESFEEDNQSEWVPNQGFVDNLILGKSSENIWIYDAILQEQIIINEICDALELNHIYSKTWATENWEYPQDFRTIFIPTSKNYDNFIMALEKILVNNIPEKPFVQEQKYTKAIQKDENDRSLILLEKWLKENGRDPNLVENSIIKPLRNIRRLRQIPAHKDNENKYDKNIYVEQKKLIEKAYWSVHGLRLMLGTHPLAKKVQIPNYLDNEDSVVIY